MAKQEKPSLYTELTVSSFSFVGKGEKSISEIYAAVKLKFPIECDDAILCTHYKRVSHQPEWKHIVRNALRSMKTKGIAKNIRRAYWEINNI